MVAVCKVCGKTLRTQYNLNLHMAVHTGEKAYKCAVCGKSFQQYWNLVTHVSRVHAGHRPFQCNDCGRSFGYKSHFKAHVRSHFLAQLEVPEPIKDRLLHPYTCSICNKAFETPSLVKQHEEMHTNARLFICDNCGKEFKTKRSITNHIENSCKASNNAGRKLKSSRKEPTPCEICGKKVARYSMHKHMNIHLRKRIYPCSFCSREFLEAGQKAVHERTHTGHKPHKCALCNKAFAQKGNLLEHNRRFHGDGVKKIGKRKGNNATGDGNLASNSRASIEMTLELNKIVNTSCEIQEKNQSCAKSMDLVSHSTSALEQIIENKELDKEELNVKVPSYPENVELVLELASFGAETIAAFEVLSDSAGELQLHTLTNNENNYRNVSLNNSQLILESDSLAKNEIPAIIGNTRQENMKHPIDNENLTKNDQNPRRLEFNCQQQNEPIKLIHNNTQEVCKSSDKEEMVQENIELILEIKNINEVIASNAVIQNSSVLYQVLDSADNAVANDESTPGIGVSTIHDFVQLASEWITTKDQDTVTDNETQEKWTNRAKQEIWNKLIAEIGNDEMVKEVLKNMGDTKNENTVRLLKKLQNLPNNSVVVQNGRGAWKWRCWDCSAILNSRHLLVRHRLRHLPAHLLPHRCKICSRTFSQAGNLQHHMLVHKGEHRFTCEHCGALFRHKSHFKTHSQQHSNEIVKQRFHCATCGKSTNTRAHLVQHIRTHTLEKPYQCQTCGKQFAASSTYDRHMKTHSAAREKCLVCGQEFSDTSGLRRHKAIHDAQKRHFCLCGRSFTQKSSLRRHKPVCEKTVTAPAKTFVCPTCQKAFIDGNSLKRHVSTHNTARSFSCIHCSLLLKTRETLQRHIKRRHREVAAVTD